MKQNLYREVREAYADYFTAVFKDSTAGPQQEKWDRVVAANLALVKAKLPAFREDQWTERN